jgi:hypothetical protein
VILEEKKKIFFLLFKKLITITGRDVTIGEAVNKLKEVFGQDSNQ